MNIFPTKKGENIPTVLALLHVLVILASLFLVGAVSLEMFQLIPDVPKKTYLRVQLGICSIFLADFFVGLILAKGKWAYFKNRFIFLLVAIPYLNIISFENIQVSDHVYYFLKLIPLVRGGYALFIITSWLTNNKATSLFLLI